LLKEQGWEGNAVLKVRVLVDNNTLIDDYYNAEAGFSLSLACDGKKILFDAGYSDLFIRNAELMGINLTSLDAIALSHGHNDHTWGLNHLVQYYDRRFVQNKPKLVLHPEALVRKTLKTQEIGMVLNRDVLEQFFTLEISTDPVQLTERLWWLGEIPRTIEHRGALGVKCQSGEHCDDLLEDDTALVYDGEDGLVILTGCSHAGICNIVSYAMQVMGKSKIADILGGFHMLNEPKESLEKTAEWLAQRRPKRIHPCHCADLAAKIALARYLPVEEVGVGLTLEYC
jgi:7,8-dihydropterin-6-yl-methyl-4-(beta-D-ribofuranosyl)aminobenzene 5'-phosphate synthase